MRLFTQTIAFALALHTAAIMATTATTCKMLSDKSSPFISSVAQLNGVSPEQLAAMPLDVVLAPVDENFPWISKCVANVNLADVVMAMWSSQEVGQCLQALDSSSELVFSHDSTLSDTFFSDDFCPMVVDTAVPCLNDVFLPVLAQALSDAGGCCSDMNAVITASFGSNLQRLVANLSKLAANAICSVKSATHSEDVGEIVETCGHSLITNFAGSATNDMELLMSLAAAVQIPESSVCAAVEGDPFKTTTGGYGEFTTIPGGEPYGICYSTMQNLVAYVKSFPIWSTLAVKTDVAPWLQKLSDLFAPGTCVRGDYLLKWALDENSVVMKAIDLIDSLGAAVSINPEHDGSSSDAASAAVGDNDSEDEGEWSASNSSSTDGSASTNHASSSSSVVSDSETESKGEGEASGFASTSASNSSSTSTDGSANSGTSASSSVSEEEGGNGPEPATSAPVASDSSSDAAVSVVSFESQVVLSDALVDGEADAPPADDASLSTSAFIRASLSAYVEPLAAVCLHFPSVKACDFGEDEITFAFSDVGHVATVAKTPAVTGATAASTTTTTTTSTTTTTTSTTPEPTTDAPESAATGDMSAAMTASRQSSLVALLALALAAAGLA